MRKYLKAIGLLLIYYLCIAFLSLEFNPLRWPVEDRVVFVIFSIFFVGDIFSYKDFKETD